LAWATQFIPGFGRRLGDAPSLNDRVIAGDLAARRDLQCLMAIRGLASYEGSFPFRAVKSG